MFTHSEALSNTHTYPLCVFVCRLSPCMVYWQRNRRERKKINRSSKRDRGWSVCRLYSRYPTNRQIPYRASCLRVFSHTLLLISWCILHIDASIFCVRFISCTMVIDRSVCTFSSILHSNSLGSSFFHSPPSRSVVRSWQIHSNWQGALQPTHSLTATE